MGRQVMDILIAGGERTPAYCQGRRSGLGSSHPSCTPGVRGRYGPVGSIPRWPGQLRRFRRSAATGRPMPTSVPSMSASPAWGKLRDYFAAVYRSPGEIQLIMDEARFTPGVISAYGDPIVVWHNIFRMGAAMGKTYELYDLARRRHPGNPKLEEALRAYIESLEEAVRAKKPEARQLTISMVQQLGQSIDSFHRLFGPVRPDVGWSASKLDIETTELQNLLTKLAGELQEAEGAVGTGPRPLDLPEFVDEAEKALRLQQRFQTSLAILISPVTSTSDRVFELKRFRPLGERLATALENLRHSLAEEILPSRKATRG
jgi:hypothetical protein